MEAIQRVQLGNIFNNVALFQKKKHRRAWEIINQLFIHTKTIYTAESGPYQGNTLHLECLLKLGAIGLHL